MSVPHYAEEYDDTYLESLVEELSPDIASETESRIDQPSTSSPGTARSRTYT